MSETTPGETPVERRLRELWEEYHGQREDAQITVAINPGLDDQTQRHYLAYVDLRADQSTAIDCGREAIRLLREAIANVDAGDAGNTTSNDVLAKADALIDESRALLARCTEGPR